MFSTESIEVILHGAQYTRVDKTIIVSNNELSYNHLDVCTNGDYVKNNNSKYINCGECFKCIRTIVTLEMINKLDKYENSFNIEKYKSHKQVYVKKYIFDKKDPFVEEILMYAKNNNINII